MSGVHHSLLQCWLVISLVQIQSSPVRNDTHVAEENIFLGYKVITIQAGDHPLLDKVLQNLQSNYQADVWSKTTVSADVMVSPEHFANVTHTVTEEGLQYSIKHDDVQRVLEDDFNGRQLRRRASSLDIKNTYLGFTEINAFLQKVAMTATAVNVQISNMGKTFEGRSMPVVDIRQRSSAISREKYVIAIDAGTHAREWIAPSVALTVINKLALNPDNDPVVRSLLEKFDWTIAPLINPDGYEYSRKTAVTRLWRKTRTTKYSILCPGVDSNRNFAFSWNPDYGASRNPCSEVYAGPTAFSEPETQNIRDWLAKYGKRLVAYITMHSFSQMLIYPYGTSRLIEKEDLLREVGNAFAGVLARQGRPYKVGNSAALLYPTSGDAKDYVKGTLGVVLSYALELPPLPGSSVSFVLPESSINKVVEETWLGFKAMAQKIFEKYGYYN